ncbi:hypothetical protein D3C73_1021380 [compost metagenome]
MVLDGVRAYAVKCLVRWQKTRTVGGWLPGVLPFYRVVGVSRQHTGHGRRGDSYRVWPRVAAGHSGLSVPRGRGGARTVLRHDANAADLFLPSADRGVLRLRTDRRVGGAGHLCHAANGTYHHVCLATHAAIDCRARADHRLHAAPTVLERAGSSSPGHAADRIEPSDHADVFHGHHLRDHWRGRAGR